MLFGAEKGAPGRSSVGVPGAYCGTKLAWIFRPAGRYSKNKKKRGALGQFLCSWICSPLKKYLSLRSHELLPREYWKLVFLASEWVGAFSKISFQSCFLLLQGPSCRKSPSTLFRSNWVKKYYYNPWSDKQNEEIRLQSRIGLKKNVFFDQMDDCNRIWPGKCWRWFPATT